MWRFSGDKMCHFMCYSAVLLLLLIVSLRAHDDLCEPCCKGNTVSVAAPNCRAFCTEFDAAFKKQQTLIDTVLGQVTSTFTWAQELQDQLQQNSQSLTDLTGQLAVHEASQSLLRTDLNNMKSLNADLALAVGAQNDVIQGQITTLSTKIQDSHNSRMTFLNETMENIWMKYDDLNAKVEGLKNKARKNNMAHRLGINALGNGITGKLDMIEADVTGLDLSPIGDSTDTLQGIKKELNRFYKLQCKS